MADTCTMLAELVVSNPADLDLRRIYADALDDTGRPDEAAEHRLTAERAQAAESFLARLDKCSGGRNFGRSRIVTDTIQRLTVQELGRLRYEKCSDENTGCRYGEAKCRAGRCAKIGNSRYHYQLWLVWA